MDVLVLDSHMSMLAAPCIWYGWHLRDHDACCQLGALDGEMMYVLTTQKNDDKINGYNA